ncbi:adenylate kinase [Nocardioides lentus]|uniref:Adenylate kinase n=1 Tax=Nocardioides lentus TaxID=338077 RepID=A0ABN2P0C5_9ACTN
MDRHRVLVTGASGSGTTTLGRSLADRLRVPHADVDDYFWLPTSPAFSRKRDAADRVRLMAEVFLGRDSWVLSGSVMGWGDSLVPSFDLAVLLVLPPHTRLDRLRAREAVRYGPEIEVGGARHAAHEEFMAWAASYDNPDFDGRTLRRHRQWLRTLPCPVLELDGDRTTASLVEDVVRHATEDAER